MVFHDVRTEQHTHPATKWTPERRQVVTKIGDHIEISTIDAALDSMRPETCVFITDPVHGTRDSSVVGSWQPCSWAMSVEKHAEFVKAFVLTSIHFDIVPIRRQGD